MTDLQAPTVTTAERTLYATRALGILFIQSAVASLSCGAILVVGYVALMIGIASNVAGTIGLGGFLLVGGAITFLIWQIAIIVNASGELKKSGA